MSHGCPEDSGPLPPVLALGPADHGDCLRLDRLALGGLWSAPQWLRELSEPRRPVFGLRAEGQLLAMASGWLVVDELHITAVAVHPEHRRLGLGRRVLGALLQEARGSGAQQVLLEVSTHNLAARSLYEALGFREVAIRRHYYRNGDDAVVQFLSLK